LKKLIAFDLDDTLAVTKQPITDRMAGLLGQLSENYKVCVITGGRYDQIKASVMERLNPSEVKLSQFFFLPLNGAVCFRYDTDSQNWQSMSFFDNLTPSESRHIMDTLERIAKQLGYWVNNPTGDIIENRGTQVTYSALGQLAEPEAKYAWDPTYEKRQHMHKLVSEALPEYEVRINGNTSIDVTQKGRNKGYGMRQFMDNQGLKPTDILFFGDQLQEAGNDYPIKMLGIETVAVTNWQETASHIEAILAGKEETNG
jgi:phosphomannomutase